MYRDFEKEVETIVRDLAKLQAKLKELRLEKAPQSAIIETQRQYNATECVLNCVRMDALRSPTPA